MIDLSKLKLGNLTFDKWRFYERETSHGTQVCVTVDVTCVNSGLQVPLSTAWRHIENWYDDNRVLQIVRDAIRDLVVHEVLETFTFDGKKVFDPHFVKRD